MHFCLSKIFINPLPGENCGQLGLSTKRENFRDSVHHDDHRQPDPRAPTPVSAHVLLLKTFSVGVKIVGGRRRGCIDDGGDLWVSAEGLVLTAVCHLASQSSLLMLVDYGRQGAAPDDRMCSSGRPNVWGPGRRRPAARVCLRSWNRRRSSNAWSPTPASRTITRQHHVSIARMIITNLQGGVDGV